MIEHLISTYGYLAILVGTFLEGETILVIAGFAAHRGYLGLPQVIAAACAGTVAGDQLFFYLGRSRSQWLLRRRPSWKVPIERVRRMLDRHQLAVVLGFRFLYGVRTVTPFAIGMSGFPPLRFLILNLVGAATWAAVIGSLGYLFGHSLELVLGDLRRYELKIMLGLAVAGAVAGLWRFGSIRRRRERAAKGADTSQSPSE
ncbi:MAG: DedA family protein [Holophagae bacterium]|nr:MAG: DedA family protein [Holophagae bacterium]